ncbi:MAG TPA: hypothetical protein VGD37_40945 [Kofleriaceae bacterium]|jgi:hypothetical protein
MKVRLAGIEHHYREHEYIKGTRIRQVLAGIAQCYPEFEAAIARFGIRVIKPPR